MRLHFDLPPLCQPLWLTKHKYFFSQLPADINKRCMTRLRAKFVTLLACVFFFFPPSHPTSLLPQGSLEKTDYWCCCSWTAQPRRYLQSKRCQQPDWGGSAGVAVWLLLGKHRTVQITSEGGKQGGSRIKTVRRKLKVDPEIPESSKDVTANTWLTIHRLNITCELVRHFALHTWATRWLFTHGQFKTRGLLFVISGTDTFYLSNSNNQP